MKTETKEMEGEKCDCGGNIIMFTADMDACNKCWKPYEPRPTRNLIKENQSLRSELQAVNHDKENMHIVHCRMLESRDKEIASLKELNGELVAMLKKLWDNYDCDKPIITRDLADDIEALIKKSES